MYSALRGALLTASVVLASLVHSPTATAQSAPPRASFSIGATQATAGYVRFDLSELDKRFATAGLPAAGEGAATVGLGFDVRRGRALFGAGLQTIVTRTRTDEVYRTRLSGNYSLLDVGYAVVKTARLSIYPIVGLGMTHVSVNVKERGDFAFDDALGDPGRELSLSGTEPLTHVGVMIERRFQRRSGAEFAFVARMGVTEAFGTQSWQSAESHVNGGPSNARGSYVRIGFSKPFGQRRDAALPIAGTLLQALVR